jgi:demethylmenaquinone methyltransferase/2-methoxy-6-polyprenyl-1,4-benzoquinol methylase
MFDGVAPRYDLLNHVLSGNMDRWWRARTVSRLSREIAAPGAVVIDLCCGSGDLMLSLAKRRGATVFGSDFCHPMLLEASRKAADRQARTPLFEADAMSLPLATASADMLTVAFGFRNLANYDKGLREMHRVLKPGGTAAILEFSTPPNPAFRGFYDFYSLRVLPRIGAFLSGEGAADAYRYLPESVRRFPGADRLAGMMTAAGFRSVRFHRMTFGIVALHLGVK